MNADELLSIGDRTLDAAALDVERAIRTRNHAAAEQSMRRLAHEAKRLELPVTRIRKRLTCAMEAANEPCWRAGLLVDYLLQHFRDSTCREPAPPVEQAIQPEILLGAGSMRDAITGAEEAVLGAGYQLYQRAGVVVRVAASRDAPGLQVVEVVEKHLEELFDVSARFVRQDAKDGGLKKVRCPSELAKMYLARRGIGWNLPTLNGVINAPTMREDGSILDMEGYDRRTGLLLDTAGQDFPAIADKPSREDAEEAADVLEDLLSEFPFVDSAVDKAAAMAAILSAVARKGLPSAPMFAFTAPTAGTGKSYLVDIVSLIATGHAGSGLAYSQDQAENRKVIDAALLAGESMILFDNVSCDLAGDRLNQILTQPSITLRVLGQSRNVPVPCGALVMVNGNSLSIAADLTRRTILCRLDAKIERPELRKFAGNPVASVRADRGKYLAAALTILRGYHVAGQPCEPSALGSFEEWSSRVRGALIWLGYRDPVSTMEHVRANDPRRSEHRHVLEAWKVAMGDRRVSTKQIIESAIVSSDLREALIVVAGEHGAINSGRLGTYLRSQRDKLVAGLQIVNDGTIGGATVWKLNGASQPTEAR